MSDAAAISSGPARVATAARPVLPLTIRNLRIDFGADAVIDGLDLELGPKGTTVIMGPNGAGKSILLKLIHGLLPPVSGQISWNGHAPEQVTSRQALVFQKPVLLRRSVAANIDFVLRNRRADRGRLAALLVHVELAHKARQPARLLSGGEAQRLALARALATDPEVLLMDEPTASLDPASTLAIETIVRNAAAQGTRVVLVTHDIGQARRLADDVVFLHRGKVTEHSPASEFFDQPRTGAARNYLDGRIVV